MVSGPEPISFVQGLSRGSRPHQTTAVRNKTFQRRQIESRLTTNANGRDVQFVAFVLYGFLNCRAKGLIVCILRHVATTTNHFFANFDSDQPLRLRRIPQDFHTLWTHGFLHLKTTPNCLAGHRVGELCGCWGRKLFRLEFGSLATVTARIPTQPNPTQPNPTRPWPNRVCSCHFRSNTPFFDALLSGAWLR